jgi:hypothetical protein
MPDSRTYRSVASALWSGILDLSSVIFDPIVPHWPALSLRARFVHPRGCLTVSR